MSRRATIHTRDTILDFAKDFTGAQFIALFGINATDEPLQLVAKGTIEGCLMASILRLPQANEVPQILHRDARYLYVGVKLDQELALLAITTDVGKNLSTFCDAIGRVAASLRDASTGRAGVNRRLSLPDRKGCGLIVEQRIANFASATRNNAFSVIQVELDRLQTLNLHYGWEISDFVIDTMIDRCLEVMPTGAKIGYPGGSNIVIITPSGTNILTSRRLLQKLNIALEQSIEHPRGTYHPIFSVGWASYPEDGSAAQTLLRATDAAIAEARRHGGAYQQRASQLLTSHFSSSVSFGQDLARAMEQENFTLEWMPILACETSEITAYEALLRWDRPGFGPVPAQSIIRNAEKMGMIERIDQWSLRAACLAAAKWQRPQRVCVNISPAWLSNSHLSQRVDAILRETGLAPGRLQIELSEKRPFGPRDIATQELSRLRALGVTVALDDFGTGVASLHRLVDLPIDQIKLDREFVKRLGEDRRNNDILQSLLQLVRHLDISSCAKGVETERQMAFLVSYACDELQGFLVGGPRPSIAG